VTLPSVQQAPHLSFASPQQSQSLNSYRRPDPAIFAIASPGLPFFICRFVTLPTVRDHAKNCSMLTENDLFVCPGLSSTAPTNRTGLARQNACHSTRFYGFVPRQYSIEIRDISPIIRKVNHQVPIREHRNEPRRLRRDRLSRGWSRNHHFTAWRRD
jgi:hypothetical protein